MNGGESTPAGVVSMASHFMAADNQDQYKGLYAMNRLSVANLLNTQMPMMQAPENWQNQAERQCNPSLFPQLLQNQWAINFWLQFQNAQLQPHLQYAALARSLVTENPLDLSNKNLGIFNIKQEEIDPCMTDKGLLDDCNNKTSLLRRNYTAEDLNQAVDDIRQGKLGTRRASVVYGIPRSTLRNKIYKLEAEGAIPSKVRRGKIAARRVEAEMKRNGELTLQSALLDTFGNGNHSDSSSPSPHASICPSSPDSTNSSVEVEGAIETPTPEPEQETESEQKIEATPLDPKWLETIWQNLFNSQNGMPPAISPVELSVTPTPIPEKPQKTHVTTTEEWKRSRPKRGQYRKYDKNALDEAVRSVRRGEMSVHRAGSFFGVPHSTLEYKVKERNLMRKKKDMMYGNDSSNSEDGNQLVTSTNSEKSDSPPQNLCSPVDPINFSIPLV